MATMLELQDLSVGYRQRSGSDVVVSSGIDLSFGAGEFICLLGPNGAGKSTLLRTLAGDQVPLAGFVRLHGENVHALPKAALAKLVSVVLTERVTSSLITVFDLVAMGRIPHTGWSGTLHAEDYAIIRDALEMVGAEEFAFRRLSDLSDGERQRCMLARALAQKPKLLLLDEITAFLDLPRRIEMMQLLQQLAHTQSVTVVLSTHDLDLAISNADRILLQPKQQALLDAGPEDLVLSGAFESAFAAEGLVFDKASGSFSRGRAPRGSVRLQADGVEAYWAQRALERVGLSCKAAEGEALAELVHTSDDMWALTTAGRQTSHANLSSVVHALRSRQEDGAHRSAQAHEKNLFT